MVPEECIDTSSVAKSLHQNLYNQLRSNYKIVQHIKTMDKKTALNGSLFWVQFKQQSLFIYLHNAPADYFDGEIENNHAAIKKKLLNDTDFIALTDFQSRLLPQQLQNYKAHLAPILIVFNNIENLKLNLAIKSLGICLFGKEKASSNSNLNELIYQFMGQSLSKAIHHHVRCVFNPELGIYSHPKDNCLLDSEQEMAMKVDMLLDNGRRRDEHLNLRGVNGGPNSGKTEIVLQRAKLINLYEHPEDKIKSNILILTPNTASQVSLNKRYYTLVPTDKKTEILSLNQWCGSLLKNTKKLVTDDEIIELVNNIANSRLKENGICDSVFLQEINFILGRAIFYEKDYLKAKRNTQVLHLTEDQYKHIWKTLLTIKSQLNISNSLLCAELPQLLWDSIQANNIDKQYDHILIDDAQLFPPIAFKIIRKFLKPKTGQLFITQDPNQHFSNACNLWKDTGLDLRGHSIRLMHSYQINPYILNAASSFYLHRLPDGLDKTIHRNLPDISKNPKPQLLHFHSAKDEENRLLDKIKKLILGGTKVKDILLISVNDDAIPHYANIITETLGIAVEQLKGDISRKKGLGICNLTHAARQATPHVFIVGLQSLFDAENNLKNNYPNEVNKHQAFIIENTHKVTMAMTSAKKDLTLFITAEKIPREFISPHIDTPNAKAGSYAEVLSLHG